MAVPRLFRNDRKTAAAPGTGDREVPPIQLGGPAARRCLWVLLYEGIIVSI